MQRHPGGRRDPGAGRPPGCPRARVWPSRGECQSADTPACL